MHTPPNNAIQLTRSGQRLQSESSPITPVNIAESPVSEEKIRDYAVSSFYLHVPFCFHKCHYCDFYSIVDSRDRQKVFTDRLIAELHAAGEATTIVAAETIFIGGGTPTLLAAEHWRPLLQAISECLRPQLECEFTVEANPETVTPELARVLSAGGVNRVSIGAQSFHPAHLKTLERWHDPDNVGRSVERFRDVGIEAINLDLIFAIPGQTLDEWLADLNRAIELGPTHISCYGLTYEPNTPMTAKLRMGRFEPAEQELEAAMYRSTCELLARAGYEHYEISAWAKPGYRCRHNLAYWSNANWWPFGPSASGHVNGVRWKNVPRLGSYLESTDLPPVLDLECVDDDAQVGEALMLGLRLIDGITREALQQLLKRGTRGPERRAAIERHIKTGLLQQSDDRVRFTQDGLLMADSVLADLV